MRHESALEDIASIGSSVPMRTRTPASESRVA